MSQLQCNKKAVIHKVPCQLWQRLSLWKLINFGKGAKNGGQLFAPAFLGNRISVSMALATFCRLILTNCLQKQCARPNKEGPRPSKLPILARLTYLPKHCFDCLHTFQQYQIAVEQFQIPSLYDIVVVPQTANLIPGEWVWLVFQGHQERGLLLPNRWNYLKQVTVIYVNDMINQYVSILWFKTASLHNLFSGQLSTHSINKEMRNWLSHFLTARFRNKV